jgi:hypothetical protein
VNIRYEENRLILGDRNATCSKCGALAAVKYAANGLAEVWHAPTDCCDWARQRDKYYAFLSAQETQRNAQRYGN